MHSVHGIHKSQVLLVWWAASLQEAELQGHARVPGKSFDGQHGIQHFLVSFVQYFHCTSQGFFFFFALCKLISLFLHPVCQYSSGKRRKQVPP